MSVYIVAGKRPKPQPTGERRVSRGGAWRHAIKVSRCSARSSIPPEYRYNDYGFRVVLTVDPGALIAVDRIVAECWTEQGSDAPGRRAGTPLGDTEAD